MFSLHVHLFFYVTINVINLKSCSSESALPPMLVLYSPGEPEYTDVLVKGVHDNLTLVCELRGDVTPRGYVWNYVAPNGTLGAQRPFTIEPLGPLGGNKLLKSDLLITDSGQYMCSAPPFSVTKYILVQNKGPMQCARGAFWCGSRCVLVAYVCDGRTDCEYGEDEDPYMCTQNICSRPDKLNCSTGRCISSSACCRGKSPLCKQPACCDEFTGARDIEGYVDVEYPPLFEDRHAPDDYGFIQSTIYTVTACALIFMIAVVLLVSAICKMQMKRAALQGYTHADRATRDHYSVQYLQAHRFPPCYEASRLLEQETRPLSPSHSPTHLSLSLPRDSQCMEELSTQEPPRGLARLSAMFSTRYRQVPTQPSDVEMTSVRPNSSPTSPMRSPTSSPSRALPLPVEYRSPTYCELNTEFIFTNPESSELGRELNYMAAPVEFFRRRTMRRNTLERVMDQLDRQRLTLQLGRFQLSIPRFGRSEPRPDTPNVAELNIDDLDFVRLNSNDTYTLNGRTIRLLGANFENYPVMPDGSVRPPPYTEAVKYKLYGPPPEYLSREGLNRTSTDRVDQEATRNVEMPPCYDDLSGSNATGNAAVSNGNAAVSNGNAAVSDGNGVVGNSDAAVDNGNAAVGNSNVISAVGNENCRMVNANTAIANENVRDTNIYNGTNNVAHGDYNIFNGNDSVIYGNSNVINGNNDTLHGNRVVINGSNDIIHASDTVINGDGIIRLNDGNENHMLNSALVTSDNANGNNGNGRLGSENVGDTNIYNGKNNVAHGDYNIFNGNDSVIYGNNNVINGNNDTLHGNRVVINGNNDIIHASDTVINGNGIIRNADGEIKNHILGSVSAIVTNNNGNENGVVSANNVGDTNIYNGKNNVAHGDYNIFNGNDSVIYGNNNVINGNNDTLHGNRVVINGNNDIIHASDTVINGNGIIRNADGEIKNHILGSVSAIVTNNNGNENGVVSGNNVGDTNIYNGKNNVAHGDYNIFNGNDSVIYGNNNVINGNNDTLYGNRVVINGNNDIIHASDTVINGNGIIRNADGEIKNHIVDSVSAMVTINNGNENGDVSGNNVGDTNIYNGKNNVAHGDYNVFNGNDSVIYGNNNVINGNNDTLYGNHVVINGHNDIIHASNTVINGNGIIRNDDGEIKNHMMDTASDVVTSNSDNGSGGADNRSVRDTNVYNGKNNVAHGYYNVFNGNDSVIFGNGNVINGNNARVDGSNSVINGNNDSLYGNHVVINGHNDIIHASNTVINGSGIIRNINGDIENHIPDTANAVVPSKNDKDKSAGCNGTVRDTNVYNGKNNIAHGRNNVFNGDDSFIKGDNNVTNGNLNRTVGNNNVINGNNNIFFGDRVVINGHNNTIHASDTVINGNGIVRNENGDIENMKLDPASVAITNHNGNGEADNSNIRDTNVYNGKNNVAHGDYNVFNGNDSIIYGNNNVINGNNDALYGNNVVINGHNDIIHASDTVINGSGIVRNDNDDIKRNALDSASAVVTCNNSEGNSEVDNRNVGGTNVYNGINNVAHGEYNVFNGNDSIVNGNHNVITGNKNRVTGDNNVINGIAGSFYENRVVVNAHNGIIQAGDSVIDSSEIICSSNADSERHMLHSGNGVVSCRNDNGNSHFGESDVYNGNNNIAHGNNNVFNGCDSVIKGNDNVITGNMNRAEGNNSVITGNNNILCGHRVVINGHNNTIHASDVVINGNGIVRKENSVNATSYNHNGNTMTTDVAPIHNSLRNNNRSANIETFSSIIDNLPAIDSDEAETGVNNYHVICDNENNAFNNNV